MPERIFLTPRRAGYTMIFLAVLVIAVAAWNVRLTQKVWHGESIRKAEERGAEARRLLGCKVFTSLEDTAIEIPLQNLNSLIAADDMSAGALDKLIKAKARYELAKLQIEPALANCAPAGPSGVRGPTK